MSELLVLCTCPDADTAQRLAHALVEQRLAACVSLLPGLRSVYRWQGEIEESSELMLLAKSTQERFPALRVALEDMHPYEVPEIIAIAIADGLPAYLDWLRAQVEPDHT